MEPTVIFEDNHILMLNKPAGWLVQGDKTGDPVLADWGKIYLKNKYEKPGEVFLQPVHRLDRPVSGVVLLARTSKALTRLGNLFRDREIQKTYFAVVAGRPHIPADELRHFLVKNRENNTVKAFFKMPKNQPEAKEAILNYETIWSDGERSLLKIKPLTGRPHQIRVQISSIGCPILGDLKYGAAAPLPDASIALHAFQLEFEHPVRLEKLVVNAPLPGLDVWKDWRAKFISPPEKAK